MKRSGRYQSSLVVILLIAVAPISYAADTAAPSMATRPYYSMFAASIDRLTDACLLVFETVDRQDLAASLSERQKVYRDFAGIDRTKPLGLMSVWGDASADIVFAPVKDIDELLKTATFGVVDFHQVSPNRFVIERPGSPYHVLVRNEYAFSADSLSTVQALQISPEQLTRGLRDRYDVVVCLDLKQIPQPIKARFVEEIRAQLEPVLQPQDDEPIETANLRKTVGKLTLELLQRVVLDTNSVTAGARLDPKSRHFILEVVVEATKGSAMANGLARFVSHRSDFASLISPDVPAGLALNLPLGGIVEQILGPHGIRPAKATRLDAGLQLVGTGLGKLSLITALRGSDAVDLNNAIPNWILKLDQSGKFDAVHESFDIHNGVVFHSLIPREVPSMMTQLAGTDVEIIVGQGDQIAWLGIGPSETVLDQLKQAIDLVGESSAVHDSAPLVRARFQARQLPELAVSGLLIPTVDKESSLAAFAKGEDGFSLTLEPISNGIKLHIEAEEGFVRLVGRDWIQQIDNAEK